MADYFGKSTDRHRARQLYIVHAIMTDLENYAKILDKSDDYRILRRLKNVARFVETIPNKTRNAIFLDLETTGLNPEEDEIIELAMVKFHYLADDSITHISGVFNQLAEPQNGPIPATITKLTGIDTAMVAGKKIDRNAMRDFLRDTQVIIAHNAGFDRKFAERFDPIFSTLNWACSYRQINWEEAGFAVSKLDYLAQHFGFFYDGHRAEIDCRAGIEILRQIMPQKEARVLNLLLARARQTEMRIWAIGAPFDQKENLKSRGYRWNDGLDGNPKSWHRDIDETMLSAELDFLGKEIYTGSSPASLQGVKLSRITAKNRFSNRLTLEDI